MKARIGLVIALAVVVSAGLAVAGPDYIGSAKCKMCHKTEYVSWEATAHAKAFEKLKADEQSNAECLKCHATGASADMPGVGCESCHGPGSDYKSMKTMKDREASIAAGLILPNEETCLGCHAGEAPHDLPAFDYATASKTGLHERKAE